MPEPERATHQRAGQAAMNTLRSAAPALYDRITGSERDPFYDDARLAAFFDYLTTCEIPDSRAESLARENLRLRAFVLDLFRDWPDDLGIDGFELQDLAVKHGLLVPVEVTEPCGEVCACAEVHDFNGETVTCYRRAGALRRQEGDERS